MMRITLLALTLALTPLLGLNSNGPSKSNPKSITCVDIPSANINPQESNQVVINAKVSELFQQIRNAEFRSHKFPELSWNDVPSLMKVAESESIIRHPPSNPLSSQSPMATQEGVIALWFIEGIRKGGKHASLNSFLIDSKTYLPMNHTSFHARALEHYRKWWDQVDPEPTEESSELIPLENTTLRWYGGG